MLLHTILTLVQLISALAIIGLVLIQRGKGADAGAGFGAGASGTVFGARGATTALSRATAVFAAIFMINSLALTYTATRAPEQVKSILDEAIPGKTRPLQLPGAALPPAPPPGAAAATTPPPSPAPAPK
jgi:preprotein translocase subunit SecG